MWIWVFRKLNAERYNSKYSAMKAMGWRENQLRFIEKASFLRLGKLLAIRNYTPGV
jgi:DNA-binding Xre family transcriptional regulator